METNFSSEFSTTQQVKILGNTAVAVENFEGQVEAVETIEAVEAESTTWLKPEQYEFDFEEAARFLAVFGEAITFQIFAANKDDVKAKGLYPKHFHGTFEQYKSALADCNKRGYDIFFMVNEGDGKGRSDENVIRVRAVYVDLDGSPLEPVLACSLKPHIIVNTSPGRYHAFWLVSDMAISDFTPVQKAIIQRFNGDKSIKDPCRVMRIPGFYHQKKEPFRSFIYSIDPEMEPYTAEQVKAEFSVVKDEVHHKAGARLKAENLTRREQSPDRSARRSTADSALGGASSADRLSARYMREVQGAGLSFGLSSVPSDYPVASFAKALSRCAFLQHCVDDAVTLSEAEWYACCSNVARCKDGDVEGAYIFHEISEPHPEYSVEETDRKIEHALSDTGPHTCSHIAGDIGFEGCSSCEWRKFSTAPVQLGTGRFDDQLQCALEEMNVKHAAVMAGSSFRILNPIMGPLGRMVVNQIRKEDFFSKYANWNVNTLVGKKIEKVNVAKEWFIWEKRRAYESVVFLPGKDMPGHYNLYRGMSVQPIQGDWSLMHDHIRDNLCCGDLTVFNYLLDLLARIVQDPGGERPGIAVVMRGEQGTGKGIFIHNFGAIFQEHYTTIANGEHLTGKFNAHLQDVLVLFVDEGYWAGDKAAEGVLKNMITDPTIFIEGKGRDGVQVANHLNIFMASNNEWVVPAGKDERRHLVLDVSSARKQDHAYFDAIQKLMDNGGREAMLHDLLNRDISKSNLHKLPTTKGLLDQKLISLDNVGKFWHDRLTQGFLVMPRNMDGYELHDYGYEWPEDGIPKTMVYEEFLEWAKRTRKNYPDDTARFWEKLRKYCPSLKEYRRLDGQMKKKTTRMDFPPLEQCKTEFFKALGWDYKPEAEVEERQETAQSSDDLGFEV